MKPYYEDGSATIYHADCRELIFCELVADAVITDPPYGETSLEWDRWPKGWPSLFCGVASQLWCFGSFRMFMREAAEFNDWTLAQDVIWEKHNGSGFASGRFKRVHETAVHFYTGEWSSLYLSVPRVDRTGPRKVIQRRGSKPTHFSGNETGSTYGDDGTRVMRSVIPVHSCHGYAEHPTQKPEGIIRPLIECSVPPRGTVLDVFMGSGTTLRAAKDIGRKAIGIEINERYCEIAARRLCQEPLAL